MGLPAGVEPARLHPVNDGALAVELWGGKEPQTPVAICEEGVNGENSAVFPAVTCTAMLSAPRLAAAGPYQAISMVVRGGLEPPRKCI